jgi:hypothetical protein
VCFKCWYILNSLDSKDIFCRHDGQMSLKTSHGPSRSPDMLVKTSAFVIHVIFVF